MDWEPPLGKAEDQPGIGGLAPAVVPADLYSECYYLECCSGFKEWREGEAGGVAEIYIGAVALAGLQPGERVLDIGTGRGETLALAIEHGARWAVGVDYSNDAVQLARRTLVAHGSAEHCVVIHGDARALPLPDCAVDVAFMLDVVEHLEQRELDAVFREVRRVLVPGGRLFIHTMPTSTIYDVTYRLQRSLLPWRLRTWPKNPRKELENLMHVNEQTVRGLWRSLVAAGFARVDVNLGKWVYTDHVPSERARRTYHRLARFRPTRALGVANILATAYRSS